MMMRKTGAALLFLLTLLCITPFTLAEEAVVWDCMPAAGSEVYPGDQVVYRLTITEAGATGDWTILTIRLGEGMHMEKDSFAFLGAEQTLPTAEGEEPATVNREVIPGNDGCVILAAKLQAGDTAVFSAAAENMDAIAAATAYTDAFSVEVMHTLKPLPEEVTPLPSATPVLMLPVETPEPEPEGWVFTNVERLVTGLVIFAGLLLFAFLLLRDHPVMKRWREKRVLAKRNGGAKKGSKVKVNVLFIPGIKGKRKKKR